MVSSIKTHDNHTYKKAKNTETDSGRIINANFQADNDLQGLAILKINSVLGIALVLSALVSMACYSFVISKENRLATINNKANELSYENMDLQTKVDNAKSLYNVNNKAKNINFLKKADKIIEVKNLALAPTVQTNNNEIKIQPVLGY